MSSDKLRSDADTILKAALAAVNPARAVKDALRLDGDVLSLGETKIDLGQYTKIVAVGAGKAGAPMAAALEDVLGQRLTAGRVVVKDGHGGPTKVIAIDEARHPVPDERGVQAGAKIAALVEEHAGPQTLFFSLISGGGSALFVSPAPGITLADKQETTRLMLACGADIVEINSIRKHLSQLKGGGLARLAHPSPVIGLIISDVVGDRLDSIASGPTVPDASTWESCKEILDRYAIWDKVPQPVRTRINAGLEGTIPDTLKQGQEEFSGVQNLVISSNRGSLDFAAAKAKELGYTPLILSSTIEGETKDIARMHAALAREVIETGHPQQAPCCLISGGETTVTLGDNPGKGGRNQEFALAAAMDLDGLDGVLALSAGTDGTDGPTDAAGAQADGNTVHRALDLGLNPRQFLDTHDAYNLFQKLDDLIITGPTRTNVMDVRLLLVK